MHWGKLTHSGGGCAPGLQLLWSWFAVCMELLNPPCAALAVTLLGGSRLCSPRWCSPAQPAPQHKVQRSSIATSWVDFGKEGHDLCRIWAQRKLKTWGFLNLFLLSSTHLNYGTADETLRQKPCPEKHRPGAGLPPGPCAYSHCLCGQGSLQPLALLQQSPLPSRLVTKK